jgi:hypothetical protein
VGRGHGGTRDGVLEHLSVCAAGQSEEG